MQNEGPRVLAERFVSTLEKGGPFKSARVFNADEKAPERALFVEGKFVALDPGSRTKRYFAGFGAGKSSVKVVGAVKDSTGRTLAHLRSASHRRHGDGWRRLARKTDGRLAQHRRGHRQIPREMGQG